MAESVQHRYLVDLIIDTAKEIIEIDKWCMIMADGHEIYPLSPLTREGFRPDFYFQYGNKLIIGEAKTSCDIDNEHSRKQYESYIKKCSVFDGEATLLLAVPWMDYACAYNIILKIRKMFPGDYNLRVLKGIGGPI